MNPLDLIPGCVLADSTGGHYEVVTAPDDKGYFKALCLRDKVEYHANSDQAEHWTLIKRVTNYELFLDNLRRWENAG